MLNHHLIPLQETGTYLQGIDRRMAKDVLH